MVKAAVSVGRESAIRIVTQEVLAAISMAKEEQNVFVANRLKVRTSAVVIGTNER
jgi:hypothetical protein